jgi:hypothetical protein
MTKPIVKIVNSETGEEIEREMNAEEFAQYEIDQASHKALKAEEATKAAAKAELHERLGITSEEASLLLA